MIILPFTLTYSPGKRNGFKVDECVWLIFIHHSNQRLRSQHDIPAFLCVHVRDLERERATSLVHMD